MPNQSSWLEGIFTLSKDEIGKRTDTKPFKYILTEGPVVKKSNGTNGKETKNKLDEYKEGLRDYQNSMISKLGNGILFLFFLFFNNGLNINEYLF